jgi:uncharacterized membrane protein YoaK (UPF0700 family)
MTVEMHTSNLVLAGGVIATAATWQGFAGPAAIAGFVLGAALAGFGWASSWRWRQAGVLGPAVLWTVLAVGVSVGHALQK